MSTYRNALPQLSEQIFLTDGGCETTLMFQYGFELPHFATFPLLKSSKGRKALKEYFERYLAIAINAKAGFILESPTWRASSDWAERLGYSTEQLDTANRQSIEFLVELRQKFTMPNNPILISGCLGPRCDGYQATNMMSEEKAADYHQQQISTFATTDADMITAMTITYAEEAIGITRASQLAGLPVVISFTTETDGHLPDGSSLEQAITKVDTATDNGPAYYMINCAHPDHFSQALNPMQDWVERIKGIRANASRKSHAELDEAEQLDSGNPQELGELYQQLRKDFPQLNILGGCCGTDHRHVEQICRSCV